MKNKASIKILAFLLQTIKINFMSTTTENLSFQVGDTVKFVKTGALDWESEDWASVAGLELQENYVVTKSGIDYEGSGWVEVNNSYYGISPLHFELVEKSKDK